MTTFLNKATVISGANTLNELNKLETLSQDFIKKN